MTLKGLTLNPTAGCRELPTLWFSFAKQTNKSLSNNSQASFLVAKTWILQEAGLPKIPNCYTVVEQLKTVSWLARSLTSSFTHSFTDSFVHSFTNWLLKTYFKTSAVDTDTKTLPALKKWTVFPELLQQRGQHDYSQKKRNRNVGAFRKQAPVAEEYRTLGAVGVQPSRLTLWFVAWLRTILASLLFLFLFSPSPPAPSLPSPLPLFWLLMVEAYMEGWVLSGEGKGLLPFCARLVKRHPLQKFWGNISGFTFLSCFDLEPAFFSAASKVVWCLHMVSLRGVREWAASGRSARRSKNFHRTPRPCPQ